MPKLHEDEEHLVKYFEQLRRLAFIKKADVRLHQCPQSDAKRTGFSPSTPRTPTYHFDLEISGHPSPLRQLTPSSVDTNEDSPGNLPER